MLLLLSFVVSGCGFQLRDSVDLSEEISPIYLQYNSAFELARELKLILATNKIALADKLSQSNSQLTLLTEGKDRTVLTIDGNGRAREYSLRYTVTFLMNIADSSKVETSHSISLSRSLLFNTDAVLAVTNESEVLYKDMQRNAARLILLKLQAYMRTSSSTVPAANHSGSEML